MEATSEDAASTTSLLRARDGSAFARCEECKKDVPVALISMHSCSLDARIKLNLEAQIVEKPSDPPKKKPTTTTTTTDRKKSSSTEPKAKKAKTDKKSKDPNAPKRPQTAFFLFMDDFRKTYKEENPDSKGGKEVAKEGGEKWKSMTDEEKKPYMDKAAELKAEYDKAKLEANNVEEDEDGNGGSEKEVEEISDGE